MVSFKSVLNVVHFNTQVWSITYHSWLTFVYLLAACIIWMIPAKRTICLTVSPLIVCYAVGLLVIQYIYGLDLTDSELPTETPSGYQYSEIGLQKYTYPCLPLAVKVKITNFIHGSLYLSNFFNEILSNRRMELLFWCYLPCSCIDKQSQFEQQDKAKCKYVNFHMWASSCIIE